MLPAARSWFDVAPSEERFTDAQSERLQALVEGWPEDVVNELASAHADPLRLAWGQTMLMALAHAEWGGAEIVSCLEPERIECRAADGSLFAVAALQLDDTTQPLGDEESAAALLAALDRTFGEQGWGLVVRRRLPAQLDVTPIARAVRYWLSAIARGDRQESHAVYEDGDVALEVVLLGETLAGRQFVVPPLTGLERVAGLDAKVVQLLEEVEQAHGALAVVIAVSGRPVPRGYAQQLLYGTARFTSTGRDGYRTEVDASSRSLFADPICRQLQALWFVNQTPSVPLGSRLTVWENPWVARVVDPPGPGFRCVEPGTIAATMGWTGGEES